MKPYWRILRNHSHPAKFIAARLLMATGLCRLLTIQRPGFRLRFHPSNLSSQLWIDPSLRPDSLSFFQSYLRPGDRVVDVGANIGEIALASSIAVGPQGKVIAIEAHPRTFAFLQDNLILNRAANVTPINSAVGANSGTVRFSDDRRDDMNRVGAGDLQVPIERLDALLPDRLPVHLLKVDVEGYEKFVFEGAPELLKRTDCVYFEVSSLHFARFGYTTHDLLALLANAGFRLFRISDTDMLSSIPQQFDTKHFENLLGLREISAFARRTGWDISS